MVRVQKLQPIVMLLVLKVGFIDITLVLINRDLVGPYQPHSWNPRSIYQKL
jgi:hypothetical protein